jgi:hypothetical protein
MRHGSEGPIFRSAVKKLPQAPSFLPEAGVKRSATTELLSVLVARIPEAIDCLHEPATANYNLWHLLCYGHYR